MTPLDEEKILFHHFYVTKYALVIPKMNISVQSALIVTLQKQASRHWLLNNLSVLNFFSSAQYSLWTHTIFFVLNKTRGMSTPTFKSKGKKTKILEPLNVIFNFIKFNTVMMGNLTSAN